MHLIILTPERKVFDGEVEVVQLPGSAEMGSFEILKGHAPIISSLAPGRMRIKGPEGQQEYVISSGFVEARNDEVNVMIEGVTEEI